MAGGNFSYDFASSVASMEKSAAFRDVAEKRFPVQLAHPRIDEERGLPFVAQGAEFVREIFHAEHLVRVAAALDRHPHNAVNPPSTASIWPVQ